VENKENFEMASNEQQDVLEVPVKKSYSKKNFLVIVLIVALASWMINTQTGSTKKIANFKNISALASQDFYNEFKPSKITSDLNLNFGSDITDDEKITIYRNLDLATSYLENTLKGKLIWIDIFFHKQELKKKLLEDVQYIDFDSGIEADVAEDGFFMENKNCDSVGSAGMTYSEYWPETSIFILTECAWEEKANEEWQLIDPDIFSHELTHAAQESWFGEFNSYSWCFVPKWFAEGQAQFVSSRISSIDGTLDVDHFRTAWLDYEPNGLLDDDVTYEADRGPYSDGAFAIEYLVGKYGWDKFAKLIKKLDIRETSQCDVYDINSRFSGAFKQTYKISLKAFYDEAKEYINWNVEKLG
jgi:hypothetical protein